MHIGILVTGPAPEALVSTFGTYFDLFTRFLDGRGFTFTAWAAVEGDVPDDPHAADGWLITGSRHGVYEDHAFIPPLEHLICGAYAAHVPMVGVCFGHQIIARALGARVEKFDGGWRVGLTDYDSALGPLRLNAFHQDQVLSVPDGAEVIASSPGCAIAGLRYGRRAWTIQPHPEFTEEYLTGLIESRARGVVPDATIDAALARTGTPNHNDRIADEIARFFREARSEEQAA